MVENPVTKGGIRADNGGESIISALKKWANTGWAFQTSRHAWTPRVAGSRLLGFPFFWKFFGNFTNFLRHRFTIYVELGRRKLQGCTLAHRQISTPSLVEIGPRITKLWSIYICKKSKFLKFFRDSWKFSKTPVPKIKSAVWRPLATAFFCFTPCVSTHDWGL